MKLEKIRSYKKLDSVLIDIVANQTQPVTINQIGEVLKNNYQTNGIYVSNRSIAMRLRGQPNIRVIQGRCNKYTKK